MCFCCVTHSCIHRCVGFILFYVLVVAVVSYVVDFLFLSYYLHAVLYYCELVKGSYVVQFIYVTPAAQQLSPHPTPPGISQ